MVICSAVEEDVGQDNIACVVDINVSGDAAVILPALARTEYDLGVADDDRETVVFSFQNIGDLLAVFAIWKHSSQ